MMRIICSSVMTLNQLIFCFSGLVTTWKMSLSDLIFLYEHHVYVERCIFSFAFLKLSYVLIFSQGLGLDTPEVKRLYKTSTKNTGTSNKQVKL